MRSNCSVAECVPEKSRWCWNEQVCQGVKYEADGLGTALCKNYSYLGQPTRKLASRSVLFVRRLPPVGDSSRKHQTPFDLHLGMWLILNSLHTPPTNYDFRCSASA